MAQDLQSQFAAAVQGYAGGWSQPDEFADKEAARLTDGIEGKWVNLYLLRGAAPEMLEKACQRQYFEISKPADLTLLFRRVAIGKSRAAIVDTTYNAIGGNSYVFTVNLDQFFAYLFPDDKADIPVNLRFSTSRGNNGMARLFRPSADILVVVRSLEIGPPDIYGRCP